MESCVGAVEDDVVELRVATVRAGNRDDPVEGEDVVGLESAYGAALHKVIAKVGAIRETAIEPAGGEVQDIRGIGCRTGVDDGGSRRENTPGVTPLLVPVPNPSNVLSSKLAMVVWAPALVHQQIEPKATAPASSAAQRFEREPFCIRPSEVYWISA